MLAPPSFQARQLTLAGDTMLGCGVTIARFVERHQEAIAGLSGEVLSLCARSGLAKVGVIAVDRRKVHANASRDENLDYEQLAREIVEEAKAVDAAEDELYGEARGDEL